MIQTPPQENEPWVHDFDSISPNVNLYKVEEKPLINDASFKWFSIVLKDTGDSEQEKKEIHEAQLEQLKKGIIRMNNAPTPNQQVQMQQQRPMQFQTKEAIDRKNKADALLSIVTKKKLGPNDKCYCNSGIKFKKCHGRGL